MKSEKNERFSIFGIRVRKIQIICVFVGILLFLMMKLAGGNDSGLQNRKELDRPPHGEGEKNCEIYVEGIGTEELPLHVSIGERAYTEEEAEKLFDSIREQLNSEVLGENRSLQEVRSSLKLPGYLDEYGIRIRWSSDEPELIDNQGNLYNEEVSEEGETVWLKAVMSDGERERIFDIPIVVYPPELNPEQTLLRDLRQLIEKEDESQRMSDVLKLPDEYRGRKLSYRWGTKDQAILFPLMGFFMAFLYSFKDKQEEMREKRIRERQLMLDYSEVVSRLMVFIGAGMTIRGSWEKIVLDYEKRGGERRFVYEEMQKTYRQLQTGMPEGEAYEEFGRRCGLQPYMKLSGLLLQNRKEGMKNLKNILRMEMTAAFEERKNLARRQGEEAGTKLLIPLFLMLAIVMVMVVAPAMMAFA